MVKGIKHIYYRSLEFIYAKKFGGRGGKTKQKILNILLNSDTLLNYKHISKILGISGHHCLGQLKKLNGNYTNIINLNNLGLYSIGKNFNMKIFIQVLDIINNNEFFQKATFKTYGPRFLVEYKKKYSTFNYPN